MKQRALWPSSLSHGSAASRRSCILIKREHEKSLVFLGSKSHWAVCLLIATGVPMLSVQPKGKQKGCAGCNRKIKDRYLLKALDKYWHEDCLKCACCDCRLGEVGSTLYTKANLILCRRDYLRLFGTTGNCAACSKLIPAFEMVMRARDNVYHLDCFACQLCNQRFCVGDKFFLKNNMILCQMDYEEGQLNGSFETQVQ
uniref:LIM zinc-binding domain-containing protein n=1 Tax=Esox lucius TaxID=8010 RepID=A0AAY5KMD2_ESOLU